jgi:hypothetical protein
VSKHENSRDRGSESGKEQASLLQPKYDGSHHPGIGQCGLRSSDLRSELLLAQQIV